MKYIVNISLNQKGRDIIGKKTRKLSFETKKRNVTDDVIREFIKSKGLDEFMDKFTYQVDPTSIYKKGMLMVELDKNGDIYDWGKITYIDKGYFTCNMLRRKSNKSFYLDGRSYYGDT